VSALAGLWLNYRRASMFSQSLAGFAALTLAGPALVLMKGSGPEVISHAAQVWAELTVFFWSSAMIVNVRIDPSSDRPTLLGLVLFLALAVTGYSAGYFSLAGVIALGLLASRFLWVLLEPISYRKLSLKKIGIIETIMAAIMITLYAVM
jgi:hypothetical protein